MALRGMIDDRKGNSDLPPHGATGCDDGRVTVLLSLCESSPCERPIRSGKGWCVDFVVAGVAAVVVSIWIGEVGDGGFSAFWLEGGKDYEFE